MFHENKIIKEATQNMDKYTHIEIFAVSTYMFSY